MRVLVLLAACAAAAAAASNAQFSAVEEAEFQALLAKRTAAKEAVVQKARRAASSPQIKVVDGKLLSVVDGDEFDHGDMASATKVKSVSTRFCVGARGFAVRVHGCAWRLGAQESSAQVVPHKAGSGGPFFSAISYVSAAV